jgi:drug/metabolite transporter (DMT)-like permease
VFALFVVALSASRSGGLKAAIKTRHIWLQIGRGLLLAAENMVMMVAFVRLGLTESVAIFAIYPLLVA